MFSLSVGEYAALCQDGALPDLLGHYVEHAELAEQYDLADHDSRPCFFAVGRHTRPWPSLVVAQRYAPSGSGFRPAALIVPETQLAFLGAGERLLCYNLVRPARLWEDATDGGFWSWGRHGDMVLMAAELELAAWHVLGNKRWSTFVEPPWSYSVAGGIVSLEVMGKESRLDLLSGGAA